jgi:hypothetical protein
MIDARNFTALLIGGLSVENRKIALRVNDPGAFWKAIEAKTTHLSVCEPIALSQQEG